MKTLIFALGLLVLCSAQIGGVFLQNAPFLAMSEEAPGLDAKESLQLIFNGVWEQGGLNDPKNIINCFNEQSANLTVTFIGNMLANIARSDAVVLPKLLLEYEKTISTSTVYCFGNDTELTDLRVAYNVSNFTVPQLELAIEKYVILHLKELTTSAAAADFYFDQQQFKQTGEILGQVAQSVVNKTLDPVEELVEEMEKEMPGLDPKESLQLIFDGVWEQGGLNDPTNIINCFNEDSANLTVNFIGDMLTYIARGNAIMIPKTILAYEKTISPSTVYCFGNDTELTDLRVAYKVSNETVPQLEVAIEKYILLHLKELTSYASSADFDFTQGQYKQVGTIFGQVAQSVVNKSAEVTNDDPISDLQSLLNGLFEQGGLPDPTTVVQCFNETEAQITLDFFGDVINDLAGDDYLALIREYHVYASGLSKNTSECIKNDPETNQVIDAYGFNNETGKTILQKYLSFGIRHHAQLLNDTKTINSDVTSGDYTDAGKTTGVLIQSILAGKDLISEQQIADGLEDVIQDMILNGY